MSISPWEPLLVGIGASLGAISRYYLSITFNKPLGLGFPYGTFWVNLSGSFLMGFIATLIEIIVANTALNLFLIIGFLGSYTTFSTYQLESYSLWRFKQYKLAFLHWIGLPILGFIGLLIGGFSALKISLIISNF